MSAGPAAVPAFDSPLLQEVAVAFARRRKSIRYHAGWSWVREFSEAADGTVERFHLDLRPILGGGLRLSVWAGGGLWFRLSVARPGRNAGWAFRDQFHGSVQDVAPATLVLMVKATLAGSFRPGESDPAAFRERLRTIWARVRPRIG